MTREDDVFGYEEPDITISLIHPNTNAQVQLRTTRDLAVLLANASNINSAYEEEFDVTFSSMLIAFLVPNNPLSNWFSGYVREVGVDIDDLLNRRHVSSERLENLTHISVDAPDERLYTPYRQTSSAVNLFNEAKSFRTQIDNFKERKEKISPLDVRHLMAAYIYRPLGHEQDLARLNFNRQKWSEAFLGQMAKFQPQEFEAWTDLHTRTFQTPPIIPIELKETPKPTKTQTTETEGISPHIASDLWTTEDALGYRDYAYAIFRFMTHRKTKPPLTISVQAPWGGGKTSLMRMVQKFIDPEVENKLKEAAENPCGELKLKEALAEIQKWISEKANRKPLEEEDKEKLENKNPKANNLTVWFNAWKYENTNQVWAGLIDAIMQQVAARLPVRERELFWLRINLKRVDTEKIRQKIHERIFNYFWRGAYVWGLGLGLSALFSALIAGATWVSNYGFLPIVGTGLSAMTVGTIAVSVLKYLKAKATVEGEPAAVSLNEYLDIPDYSKEIGFIHKAEADVKNVLESIPEKYKPLVIFIDDLDRCSPTKISQVVEAVNLFLAGDFPNCMFVIGMDTEMVAAALQSAHKDMIANLPSDAGIPVGWRFMDKFVQLPFLIPPNLQRFTKSYIDSLFAIEEAKNETTQKDAQTKVVKIVEERVEQISAVHFIEEETKKLREENNLAEEETALLQKMLRARVNQRTIDKGIETFNDRNEEIRKLIDSSVDSFIGNPRELKRFVNAFRFNYFLWWAQRAQGSEVTKLEQLLRWTVLSMKWPEVVRWLRRSGGNEWETTTQTNNVQNASKTELVARLRLLEKIANDNDDFAKWQENASKRLQLELKTTSWLNDDDLFQFFRKECNQNDGHKLSDGIGKGLW